MPADAALALVSLLAHLGVPAGAVSASRAATTDIVVGVEAFAVFRADDVAIEDRSCLFTSARRGKRRRDQAGQQRFPQGQKQSSHSLIARCY